MKLVLVVYWFGNGANDMIRVNHGEVAEWLNALVSKTIGKLLSN